MKRSENRQPFCQTSCDTSWPTKIFSALNDKHICQVTLLFLKACKRERRERVPCFSTPLCLIKNGKNEFLNFLPKKTHPTFFFKSRITTRHSGEKNIYQIHSQYMPLITWKFITISNGWETFFSIKGLIFACKFMVPHTVNIHIVSDVINSSTR